jgi:hypothetical protein
MSALFGWIWILGGGAVAVLSEVLRAESPRTVRIGRIAFAFLLWADLLFAAVMLSIGNAAAGSHGTTGLWWFTVVVAGIPLALISGFAVRRAYRGRHRPVLAAATLATAALYVAFPLAFTPFGEQPIGLGLWVHEHHLLSIAILAVPTLILLADELSRTGEEAPSPMSEPRDFQFRGRGVFVAVALVVFLVWMIGTNGSGMLLGLGVVLFGGAVFAWRWNRSLMRSLRRDLKPPDGS